MFLRQAAKKTQNVVKVVKVKMVKIEKTLSKSATIYKYIFIYSEQMTAFPKSILTKMTMTKMTTMYSKNLEVTK